MHISKDTYDYYKKNGVDVSGWKTDNDIPDMITGTASKYGIPPQLLHAQANQESGFNPNAVSPVGAQGVMQIMPETAKELGLEDPFDAEQNIDAGARYLKQQYDKYKDWNLALAAYNAGPGKVDEYGGIPPFKETQNYVKNIIGASGQLTEQQNQNDNQEEDLISPDTRDYYKAIGIDLDNYKPPPKDPSFLDEAVDVAKAGVENVGGGLNAVRRGLNSTAAGILNPVVDMAAAANPITLGEKAGAAIGQKLGLPVKTPISDFQDKGVAYAKNILNQGMSEPPTDFENKTGINLTASPIAPYINAENAKVGSQKMIQTLGLPEDSVLGKAFTGAIMKASDTLGGIVTPTNAALLGLGLGGGGIGKAVSASFVPGMAEQTVKGIKEAGQGISEKNPEKIGSGIAEAALGGAFTAGAMKGAVGVPDVPLNEIKATEPISKMFERQQREKALVPVGDVKTEVSSYKPTGKGKAFVMDEAALKREPFADPKVKRLIEKQTVEYNKEQPIEEAPILKKDKPLFPFLPEEMAPEREIPQLSAPEALRPRKQVGFTAEILRPKLKIEETPYPNEYKVKADESQAWRSPITKKELTRIENDLSLKLSSQVTPEKLQKTLDDSNISEKAKQAFTPLLEQPVTKKEVLQYVKDIKKEIQKPIGRTFIEGPLPKISMPFGAIKKGFSDVAAPLRSERGFIDTAPVQEYKPILKMPRFESIPQEPIKGTGEMKVRGLSEGVEAKAIEKKLTQGFGGLPEYQSVNMKEQASMAADLISRDYPKAKKIAMGEEAPPQGVIPESVFTAVENKALKEGDVNTIRDLATKSKLTSEATTMGQRIRTLAERDPESPIAAIKEVFKAREDAVKRRQGVNDISVIKKSIAKTIKEEIKKSAPSRQSWAEFIKSIEC